jgi:hypothetical protein
LVSRHKTEAVTPPEAVERLLQTAGENLVLVGGQALALWVSWYGLALHDESLPAISNDVDFLSKGAADRQSVRRLADAIKGKVLYPNEKALTALVGQAYLDISEAEYVNVDVIFKVLGMKAEDVRQRARRIVPEGRAPFLVMHPLDVLYSRLINLYKLPEKQNDKGRMQLALAIDVGRAFLRQEAKEALDAETAIGRSPIQEYVSTIEKMAIDDAGRKVAARHGLHVADAIDPHLIPAGPFWTKRWPALKELMSPAYSGTIRPPNTAPQKQRS